MRLNLEDILKEVRENIDYYSWTVASQTDHALDDVRQELMIRIWQAKKKFEKKRGNIRNYFITVIKNHIRNMIKKANTTKAKSSRCISLNKEIKDEFCLLDKLSDPRDDFAKRLEQRDLIKKIYNALPDGRCKDVFLLMAQGKSLRQMAKIIGIAHTGVHDVVTDQIKPVIDRVTGQGGSCILGQR